MDKPANYQRSPNLSKELEEAMGKSVCDPQGHQGAKARFAAAREDALREFSNQQPAPEAGTTPYDANIEKYDRLAAQYPRDKAYSQSATAYRQNAIGYKQAQADAAGERKALVALATAVRAMATCSDYHMSKAVVEALAEVP